ncbi:MAG: hypothetical protein Kow0088_00970 [Anaerolineales bacterium]
MISYVIGFVEVQYEAIFGFVGAHFEEWGEKRGSDRSWDAFGIRIPDAF